MLILKCDLEWSSSPVFQSTAEWVWCAGEQLDWGFGHWVSVSCSAHSSTLLGLSFPIYKIKASWEKWSSRLLLSQHCAAPWIDFIVILPGSPKTFALSNIICCCLTLLGFVFNYNLHFSYYCVIIYRLSLKWCLKSFITQSILVSYRNPSSVPFYCCCYHCPKQHLFLEQGCIIIGRNLPANCGVIFCKESAEALPFFVAASRVISCFSLARRNPFWRHLIYLQVQLWVSR